jgi:hypothetical protein
LQASNNSKGIASGETASSKAYKLSVSYYGIFFGIYTYLLFLIYFFAGNKYVELFSSFYNVSTAKKPSLPNFQ